MKKSKTVNFKRPSSFLNILQTALVLDPHIFNIYIYIYIYIYISLERHFYLLLVHINPHQNILEKNLKVQYRILDVIDSLICY